MRINRMIEMRVSKMTYIYNIRYILGISILKGKQIVFPVNYYCYFKKNSRNSQVDEIKKEYLPPFNGDEKA